MTFQYHNVNVAEQGLVDQNETVVYWIIEHPQGFQLWRQDGESKDGPGTVILESSDGKTDEEREDFVALAFSWLLCRGPFRMIVEGK